MTMFKDSLITAQRKKREATVALCCFAVSFLVNVGCVIGYECPWTEIFTQIGFVLVFAIALYVIVTLIRLVIHALSGLFGKCRG